jgi:Zn-dependent protease
MVVFLSTAWGRPVWILLAGGVMLQHLAGHRIGFFRYGLNYYEAGWISMSGPLSNLVLAVIFKAISGFINNSLISLAITFNLLFAFYNVLPIPPLDGSRMFFGSRLIYALSFFFVLAAVILLWVDIPIVIALVGAVLIALIGWLLYYIFIEKGFWHGPY